MLSTFASAGCLVLDEVTFPEDEPSPTFISDDPNSDIKIGSVLAIPEATENVRWNVLIHDENVRENLKVRIFEITENTRRGVEEAGYSCDPETHVDTKDLLANGTESRSLQLILNNRAEPSCSQLMLVVAQDFAVDCTVLDTWPEGDFKRAATLTNPPGQAGVATWWIATTPNPDIDADLTACVRLFTEIQEADAP